MLNMLRVFIQSFKNERNVSFLHMSHFFVSGVWKLPTLPCPHDFTGFHV